MCGIAGICGHPTVERLRRMNAALRHRGPDDENTWIKPEFGIGLAHCRLAVIDLTTGRQPISNEDGTVTTIFNGEIYNYRELREELIARGHRLVTQSDTEVIVHLYEELGPALVAKLQGMFAIAIWDQRERQLVLLRDRLGKKSVYYADVGGEFLFSSEIKGLVAGATAPFTIDPEALDAYWMWTVVPAPRTIYREVRAASPGELLVVRDAKIVRRNKYWQLRMSPKLPVSREGAVDRIDGLLRNAVRLRLRADVPVGCFLSGGIDSGLITAMAAQQHSAPIRTITVGFEDAAFDERPLARLVAERYRTDHHELELHPRVADDLPRIAAAFDQPFADSSAIPTYYVAQAARTLVKSVLNGDGGDEFFAGYRRYVAVRLSRRMAWLDGPRSRAGWRWMARIAPTPRSYRSAYAFVHRLARGMGLEPVSRYLAWSVDGPSRDGWRTGDVAPGAMCRERSDGGRSPADKDLCDVWDSFADCGPLDRTMAVDSTVVLPNDLLVKMDIATMAHGLEARSPLLDHELIETVSRFPESLKLGGCQTKPLLRDLAARYLPDEICRAPKRGFEVPLVRWLRGDLRPLVEDLVLSRSGLLTELFRRDVLEDLVRNRAGLDPARWSRHVWMVTMLAMWDHTVNRGAGIPAYRDPSAAPVPIRAS